MLVEKEKFVDDV